MIIEYWLPNTKYLEHVFVYLYSGPGSTGKFEFDSGWRLHVAAILFCPKFVYF